MLRFVRVYDLNVGCR